MNIFDTEVVLPTQFASRFSSSSAERALWAAVVETVFEDAKLGDPRMVKEIERIIESANWRWMLDVVGLDLEATNAVVRRLLDNTPVGSRRPMAKDYWRPIREASRWAR